MKTLKEKKPTCKLIGTDGNIFALMGRATECLRKHNLHHQVSDMRNDVMNSKSYSEALLKLMDYVKIR